MRRFALSTVARGTSLGARRFTYGGLRGLATQENKEKVIEGEVVEEEAVPGRPATTEMRETISGDREEKQFQAETLKLLNIVTHSLYSKKEVFLRELISNSSDALEKARQLSTVAKEQWDDPLEIDIYARPEENQLIIQDTGVGMTKEELVENLGTIAHSGTQEFLSKIDSGQDGSQIIGQFGVGFYSVFMVADRVTVYSRQHGSDVGYMWTSDGSGKYEIAEADNVSVGTKIQINLKDECKEYADKKEIKKLITNHSNFVNFPIHVDGEQVNTVQAIWTQARSQVKASQHEEFYQFISGKSDKPQITLMYQIDSPLNIRSVLYVGATHKEMYGMENTEPGVSLYSRRVLIQPNARGLLPEWLRFVHGVVDSEDVPLSVSREHLQDQRIIQKLNNVLTKRILKEFRTKMKKNPKAYDHFFKDFGLFLKQGLCSDERNRKELAQLLRFETSGTKGAEKTCLAEYIERMKDNQQDIYYLHVPSRALGETSPYYEAFKAKGIEVIFVYSLTDDVVMQHIVDVDGTRVISIESGQIDLSSLDGEKGKEGEKEEKKPAVSKETSDSLCKWIKDNALKGRVSDVISTDRLVDTPVLIADYEGAQMRRMMKMMDAEGGRDLALPPQKLQVNAAHPLMQRIVDLKTSDPELATLAVEQLFDGALLTAGLLDDSRAMLPRINTILSKLLTKQ